MTTAIFRTEQGRITGFIIEGHSGYAEAGEDIVCAAVTSAVRLTETALNDVMGLAAPVKIREKDAYLALRLPGGLSSDAEETCQILLTALMVYLSGLRDEYPKYLEVREQEN